MACPCCESSLRGLRLPEQNRRLGPRDIIPPALDVGVVVTQHFVSLILEHLLAGRTRRYERPIAGLVHDGVAVPREHRTETSLLEVWKHHRAFAVWTEGECQQ